MEKLITKFSGKLLKWGNSFGLVIPKGQVEGFDLMKGKRYIVEIKEATSENSVVGEVNPLCWIQSDNHTDRRFIDSDFLDSKLAII